VKFERVGTPASLAPGLSLGSYPSAAEANRALEALGHQGVHTARVVQMPAGATLRHVQVRSTSMTWRLAAGAQKFGACAAPSHAPPATAAASANV
jgi:hypothetical protein